MCEQRHCGEYLRYITHSYWRLSGLLVMRIAAMLCLLTNLSLAAQKSPRGRSSLTLPVLPEVRLPLLLRPHNDSQKGMGAFSFDGREIPPVIHTTTGSQIRV